MRNLVGMSILGLTLGCFLLSGCGGGLGEAKVTDLAKKEVKLYEDKLAALKEEKSAARDEKVKKISEAITNNKKEMKFSDDDQKIYDKNFKTKLTELEKECNKLDK